MVKYYYEHEGELQEVEMSTKALPAFKASNPHLTVLRASELGAGEADEVAERHRKDGVRRARAKEYPSIGDQLDAIMKWAFTESEITVTPELKSLAAQCMSVKSRHPLE